MVGVQSEAKLLEMPTKSFDVISDWRCPPLWLESLGCTLNVPWCSLDLIQLLRMLMNPNRRLRWALIPRFRLTLIKAYPIVICEVCLIDWYVHIGGAWKRALGLPADMVDPISNYESDSKCLGVRHQQTSWCSQSDDSALILTLNRTPKI